jgi:NitT/TauT family transport system permease protein
MLSARRASLEPALLLIALVAVWEGLAARGLIDVLFFPPPSDWFAALAEMAGSGVLGADVSATASRLVRGLGLGVTFGYASGLMLGRSARAYRIFNPFVTFLHPLPKIALFPLLLLLLGLGERPKIAVVAIAAFFPIFINTVLGVREVDTDLVEVAASYGASGRLILRRVIIPGSLPAVMSGLRLSFNSALTSAIALELVSSGNGLGARIWISWQNLRTDRLFAVITVVALIGFTSNLMLQLLHRRLAPWRAIR